MKKITYTQGEIEYEICGLFGSWCKSYESVLLTIGTTRLIGGELMSVYTKYNRETFFNYLFGGMTYEYNWGTVNKSNYDSDKNRFISWVNNL